MNKKKLTFDAFIVKAKIQNVDVITIPPHQQTKIIGGADGLAGGAKAPGGSKGV